jgi:hypothetical protein
MFTEKSDYVGEPKLGVNPVQFSPLRSKIFSINRFADEVIGFEFIKGGLDNCCHSVLGLVAINFCLPTSSVVGLDISRVEFLATDDPCYKKNLIEKTASPGLVLEKDAAGKITGVLVRFFRDETKCLPTQLAYKLYVYDKQDCRIPLSEGLLIFK